MKQRILVAGFSLALAAVIGAAMACKKNTEEQPAAPEATGQTAPEAQQSTQPGQPAQTQQPATPAQQQGQTK